MEKENTPLSWTCRFHPTEWFHEIGCPHEKWTKEDLQKAIETRKSSEGLTVKRLQEAKEEGIQQGKREALADAERIARETMDSLELKTNAEYNACDDLTKRIVNKIWDKLSSLANSSKDKV